MTRYFLTPLALTAVLTMACISAQAQRSFPTNKPEGDLNVLTADEKADGWQLLFNGKNLDGWAPDQGDWSVEDGMIIGQHGTGHLFSDRVFKDVVAEWDVCAYDVAIPKKRFGNSGVFVRTVKTGGSFPKGYEIQFDPYDVNNPTGGIYGRNPGTLLVENGKWKKDAFFEVHEGKWIHQKVEVRGNHFKLWVNGELCMDWTDDDNAFPDADPLALQCHHPTDVVLFANIKVKPLD
ncbi:MAG: DUF1080 domain-containing protein [bacterium]|nr:DUF1080 domain-containing protein [bacterium]